MSNTLKISTKSAKQIIDITVNIEEIVSNEKAKEGFCLVFAQHTTCSVMLGEYEPGLDEDFLSMFDQLKPKGPFKHAHEPDHAPSHLFSSMVGEQVTIPIESGKLALGTWQRVMLVEFDGPRERKVVVKTLQEK